MITNMINMQKNSSSYYLLSLLLLGATIVAKAQTPQSASVLEFDDQQTLFIGDSYGGYIHAYELNEPAKKEMVAYNLRNLDSKVAKALGTTTDKIKITDLAVNPVSKNAFISIHKIVGDKYMPVIVKVTPEGQVFNFNLKKNKSTRFKVNDTYQTDLTFWKSIPLMSLTFTDLDYHQGKLYVAGLSNADFDASLRVIDFPFQKSQQHTTTVEIFHTVHNQQETRSPIQTLEIINIKGEEYILAVYTCTPMVLFPLKDIKDGAHLTGKVIAELGYGNAPIDVKTFSAQDAQGNVQEVALVINKTRASMLFNITDIAVSNEQAGLSEAAGFGTAGTPFFTPAMGGTYQLENLDAAHLLTLRRNPETGQTEMVSYLKGFYFRLSDFVSDYIYPDYKYGEKGELWRPIQNTLKIDEGHPETVVEKR